MTNTIVARSSQSSAEPDAKPRQFNYKGRNSDGKIVTGTAQALRAEDVNAELLRRQLVPLAVTGGGTAGGVGGLLTTDISFRRAAKKRDLVVVSRYMASMLDAGLSYLESLDIVRADCEDQLLASGLNEVRTAIANGSTFSAALTAQGDLFPPMMINFITAGEAAGDIKGAMNRVADQLEADEELRNKVKKAVMSPLITLAIAGLIFLFMMVYLIPKFTGILVELGGPDVQLPFITRMVMKVSDILKIATPVAILGAGPFYLWYRANKNKAWMREFVDPRKLKIPVFGGLNHKIALSRFCRNLSGLLGAGVDRLEALEIAARTCGNIDMERAVLAARDAQRGGMPLVTPLKEEPLFPTMVTKMVEVGEESGQTAHLLSKAADVIDRDIDLITARMQELIKPIFTIIIGVIVGILAFAVYLPYLNIGQYIDA